MSQIDKIIDRMRAAPHDVPFDDVAHVCKKYFGNPRKNGSSHKVYKMPWSGDPRVNIQKGSNGKAKEYQVKQVLEAIEKLKSENTKENGDENAS